MALSEQTFVNSQPLHLWSVKTSVVPHSAQHLREWFTPTRRKIISSRALDALAQRPLGTLSRFLSEQEGFTFERSGLASYYPFLALVGYEPPAPEH
jgi:hypothetical protein